MAVTTLKTLIFAGLATGLVAACEPGTNGTDVTTAPLDDAATTAAEGADTAAATVAPARTVKLVDHDVEAPDDFQTTDKALWDGRPSLGGVWVAATNVTDPMRVIMRNPGNGKFVIGALFRREADNPGPKLQISSDAADALGLVAGEPATITVTALRREEVPATQPDANRPLLDTSETVAGTEVAADAVAAVTAPVIKPSTKPAAAPAAEAPAASQPAANQPATNQSAANPPAAEPAAAAPAAPAAGGKSIQIGIFSVEDNAKRAVATLAKAGITATIRKETSLGKPLWSVIASGNAALLAQIKKAGFADAYFLKR